MAHSRSIAPPRPRPRRRRGARRPRRSRPGGAPPLHHGNGLIPAAPRSESRPRRRPTAPLRRRPTAPARPRGRLRPADRSRRRRHPRPPARPPPEAAEAEAAGPPASLPREAPPAVTPPPPAAVAEEPAGHPAAAAAAVAPEAAPIPAAAVQEDRDARDVVEGRARGVRTSYAPAAFSAPGGMGEYPRPCLSDVARHPKASVLAHPTHLRGFALPFPFKAAPGRHA